jgi:hypothetical protein
VVKYQVGPEQEHLSSFGSDQEHITQSPLLQSLREEVTYAFCHLVHFSDRGSVLCYFLDLLTET